jgi:hypothetical protein
MRWTRARSRALASKYGPANQGSGRPERARAGADRPHEEHGALLRPISRADAVRRIVPGAPLGPDRRRRANTNRPSCFPANRADRAQHMARTQAAPWLPTPRLIAFDRAPFATLSPGDRGHPVAKACLQLLHRSITLLRCGFTPVYALLGRFLPRLKAASGRPPFLAITLWVRPTATWVLRCSSSALARANRGRRALRTYGGHRALIQTLSRSDTRRPAADASWRQFTPN